MFRPLEAIIGSRFGYPGEEDGFGWLTATYYKICCARRTYTLIQYTCKQNGDDPPK